MNHKLYNIAYSILFAAAICGGLLMVFGWLLAAAVYAAAADADAAAARKESLKR